MAAKRAEKIGRKAGEKKRAGGRKEKAETKTGRATTIIAFGDNESE